MKSILLVQPIVLSLMLTITPLLPVDAFAQDGELYVFGGDSCYARNADTAVGRKLIRVGGVLKNTHEKKKATVYCPIPAKFPTGIEIGGDAPSVVEMSVRIYFHNSHPLQQTFTCLTETRVISPADGRFGNFDHTTYKRVIETEDDGTILMSLSPVHLDPNALVFHNPPIEGYNQYNIVSCGLPPQSEILTVIVRRMVNPLTP